jgi:calcineurin-like phosphoesterase family protein
MANVLFIGDCHFGHRNQIRWRPFESEEQITELILSNLRKRVTKRDIVYFLGDIILSQDRLTVLDGIPGKKILVAGNHCTEHLSMRQLVDTFDEVHAIVKYKEFWLTHAPIHPDELRGKVNIHGHVHTNTIDDKRYVNVSCEAINYSPVSLHKIRASIYQ